MFKPKKFAGKIEEWLKENGLNLGIYVQITERISLSNLYEFIFIGRNILII